MGYQIPVPYARSTSWLTHTRRNPPSTEAGIDYFCPIGTPVRAAESGRIVDTGDSIQPATGRFVTIDLDDGHRVRYLHLSTRAVSTGQRVARGQVVGYSGATGYGEEDWSWNVNETGGAHVHMTLWRSQQYSFGRGATLDPGPYMDAPTFASVSAAIPLIPPIPKEHNMRVVRWAQAHVFVFGEEQVTHLDNWQHARAAAIIHNPDKEFQELDDVGFTVAMMTFGVPWSAVDACMRGLAYDISGAVGGRYWSRSIEQKIDVGVLGRNLASSIEELKKRAESVAPIVDPGVPV